MKSFLAAIQFLTILPVPRFIHCGEENFRRSLFFFPVVGLILGIAAAYLDHGLGFFLPPLPASVMVAIFLLGISGCLHSDGLADMADGFFSSRPRERILEIMKDSRTGPMGVTALVCAILFKVSLLTSIPSHLRWETILLVPLAGRCALLVEMAALPYARKEGGLASVFLKGKSRLNAAWAVAALAVVGWWALKTTGLVAAGISLGTVLLFSFWCHRKIGGFTGDTLGAACEIAEIMPLLVVTAAFYGGWI